MIGVLVTSLIVSLAINVSMFLVAYRLKSDKLTDISYAVTFITIAGFSVAESHKDAYHLFLAVMIFVWAIRLGSFLLYRVLQKGKDSRFDEMRDDFVKFGKFWLAQAVTVWLLMVPAVMALQAQSTWTALTLIGLITWAAGFLTETVADYQKMTLTPKGKWIDRGLWNYSRHPNYFGEILVWAGVYLYTVTSLSLTSALVGLVSPLFITVLLLFVSGIPILEKSADEKWGKTKGYQAYKTRTSILIPLPKRN